MLTEVKKDLNYELSTKRNRKSGKSRKSGYLKLFHQKLYFYQLKLETRIKIQYLSQLLVLKNQNVKQHSFDGAIGTLRKILRKFFLCNAVLITFVNFFLLLGSISHWEQTIAPKNFQVFHQSLIVTVTIASILFLALSVEIIVIMW